MKAAQVLRIRRTLPAPREEVFRAFTRPEPLQQWWGPKGFTLPEVSLDLRVGGQYRFGMQPAQGHLLVLKGTFREIRPPEKLVYTWAWEGIPLETLVTLEFRDVEGDTEVLLTQEPFPDDDSREQHDIGWTQQLERLDDLLKKEDA
jgi:uncharacterized protein YndB with AHSA1/START domain